MFISSEDKCCNADWTFPDSYDEHRCLPIEIPADDPFFEGHRTCMSFTRSRASPSLKCSLEYRQQVRYFILLGEKGILRHFY